MGRGGLEGWLRRRWRQPPGALAVLAPVARAYGAVVARRAARARAHPAAGLPGGVPVVVVGNLTVGGSGKTPVVRWLAQRLAERGLAPGIVSRGHGGRPPAAPLAVTAETAPAAAGDEPVWLARVTGVPVVVDRRRRVAAEALLAWHPGTNVVLADDGLAHFALPRAVEVLVINGASGLGNGRLLPVGPLREPPAEALRRARVVLVNGGRYVPEHPCWARFALVPGAPYRVAGGAGAGRPVSAWAGQKVTAVAGIGAPERFFATLSELGMRVAAHPFADHHPFTRADLAGLPGPVMMTEKDAVKVARFATPADDWWALPVNLYLAPTDAARVLAALDAALAAAPRLPA